MHAAAVTLLCHLLGTLHLLPGLRRVARCRGGASGGWVAGCCSKAARGRVASSRGVACGRNARLCCLLRRRRLRGPAIHGPLLLLVAAGKGGDWGAAC